MCVWREEPASDFLGTALGPSCQPPSLQWKHLALGHCRPKDFDSGVRNLRVGNVQFAKATQVPEYSSPASVASVLVRSSLWSWVKPRRCSKPESARGASRSSSSRSGSTISRAATRHGDPSAAETQVVKEAERFQVLQPGVGDGGPRGVQPEEFREPLNVQQVPQRRPGCRRC